MAIDYLKPFRLSMKLAPGKQPHIFTVQLKKIMENDTSLHPMMEKTLKMLKKTHTPYIMLAPLREVVFDLPNNRHFDRSAEPVGAWVCTLWSDEEIAQAKDNPEEYVRASLKLFEALGYELFDAQLVTQEYLDTLTKLTLSQIESQLAGRSLEE